MSENQFPVLPEGALTAAKEQTLAALRDPESPKRVLQYFDPQTNCAGATFAGLEPHDQSAITATDLLAVTTLAIDIRVLAIRRFLEDDNLMSSIEATLKALPKHALEETTEADFAAMAVFYDLVKASLARAGSRSSNSWVTSSKTTARKRPDLFPVRDNDVCKFLRIDRLGDRAKDWVVFRELMRDEAIRSELDGVIAKVNELNVESRSVLDKEPLRLLDVVLWTAARRCVRGSNI